jgi:hypothetical protein
VSITATITIDGSASVTKTFASLADAVDYIYTVDAQAVLEGKGFSYLLNVPDSASESARKLPPRGGKRITINIA